ncbi:hypothetical protein EET67_09970 [Pseudaminobacter arsenicus]|uniref:Uncharacterized protein n=1 Tax=Borborobacter arsenicus TaxID=1851146 RepID=A0A432V6X9_9HYPH|nr:hypothetical protein [Pseudaminobacter arsenicus]RUM97932.1 hypothetical protein EET67_09970 [Pseudaminobacter arsenicus]
MVQTEIVREKVPDALIQPCLKQWRKKGGPATTEDFVKRGDANEDALRRCAAQIDGIREWSEAQP